MENMNFTILTHAWEKQEEKLLKINGQSIWVPNKIANFFYWLKPSDCEFAKEFVISYKQAWWYLKGFKRKSENFKQEDFEKCYGSSCCMPFLDIIKKEYRLKTDIHLDDKFGAISIHLNHSRLKIEWR